MMNGVEPDPPHRAPPSSYLFIYDYIRTKTFLSRPSKGLTLNGPFREVAGLGKLEYASNGTVGEPNEAINKGESSICGGGRLERFYCIYMENMCI